MYRTLRPVRYKRALFCLICCDKMTLDKAERSGGYLAFTSFEIGCVCIVLEHFIDAVHAGVLQERPPHPPTKKTLQGVTSGPMLFPSLLLARETHERALFLRFMTCPLTGKDGAHGIVERLQHGVRGVEPTKSPDAFRRLGNWPAHR